MFNWSSILEWLVNSCGKVLAAVLLLALAFIVSAIVKGLVEKLLAKTKLSQWEATANASDKGGPQGGGKTGLIQYFGKITYLVVFLLFIPGIFSALGLSAVSDPINGLLVKIWGFVPNLIAAIIVLIAGSMVAKLVRELLIPLFRKLNVDSLQEKAGLKVKDDAKLSVTLAYIVYVLIIIPVIITALQALKISAVAEPAIGMLQKVFDFIPNIIVAIVLILIGVSIARFTAQIVKQLIASSGADAKVREAIGDKVPKFVLSNTVGMVVQIVLDIFFVVEGTRVLSLDVLTSVGETIIAYLPNALASVLIVIAALLLAAAIEKAMEKNGLKDYAVIARSAILIVAGFMVLNQLGIAQTIVNYAFIIILAAIGVAFAISFGIGGREFAAHTLKKLSDKMDENDKKKNNKTE